MLQQEKRLLANGLMFFYFKIFGMVYVTHMSLLIELDIIRDRLGLFMQCCSIFNVCSKRIVMLTQIWHYHVRNYVFSLTIIVFTLDP